MTSIRRALAYGFLLWLVPFLVSILIFPLKKSGSPLFESIMPVTLTVCVVIVSIMYLRKVRTDFLLESVKLGVIWLLMSIIIDLGMFMWGPMKMSFVDYMCDIGLTYLVFPTVTIGYGCLLDIQRKAA
jgi:hypothetical protein